MVLNWQKLVHSFKCQWLELVGFDSVLTVDHISQNQVSRDVKFGLFTRLYKMNGALLTHDSNNGGLF